MWVSRLDRRKSSAAGKAARRTGGQLRPHNSSLRTDSTIRVPENVFLRSSTKRRASNTSGPQEMSCGSWPAIASCSWSVASTSCACELGADLHTRGSNADGCAGVPELSLPSQTHFHGPSTAQQQPFRAWRGWTAPSAHSCHSPAAEWTPRQSPAETWCAGTAVQTLRCADGCGDLRWDAAAGASHRAHSHHYGQERSRH